MHLPLDEVLKVPDSRRRRFHFGKRRLRQYRLEKRPKFTKEQLVQFLRRTGIRSTRKLESQRVKGDPTWVDFRREFKYWRLAQMAAFGVKDDPIYADPEYMAKLVIQFDLWTWKRYIEARHQRPDIVPSTHQIIRRWGRFINLREFSRRYSIRALLTDYLHLKRRLGHVPNLAECRSNNLHLDKAVDFFGSKKRLDDFLDRMEQTYEKSRRDSQTV